MSLWVKAGRSFVFESLLIGILRILRAPRREILIPLHVKWCSFHPSIFPVLVNFYSVGYLLNKIRGSDWLLRNQIAQGRIY